jgi:mannose-1-phosphate guanylyltransferase
MQEKPFFVIIMAGGIGSRFYPFSREKYPKQFQDILGRGKTLLRESYERLAEIADGVFVVTHQNYVPLVSEQLPEISPENILAEPFACNTAPCIAYAAYKIRAKFPDAVLAVIPADHLIEKEADFRQIITEAKEFVRDKEAIVTLGIEPTRPDTGYGYIRKDTASRDGNFFKVANFTEKPNREKAEEMLLSGEYLWNAGIFVWSLRTIISAFERHLPVIHDLFERLDTVFYTPEEEKHIETVYRSCEKISVDVGIMEKAENVYVLPSAFGWSDLGTWKSLYEISEKNTDGNVVNAQALLYETKNCIIKGDKSKLIIVQGLEDYIVAEHDGVVLICKKDEEQRIKQFLQDAKDAHGKLFE